MSPSRWNQQNDPNPIERINEQLKINDVGRFFAVVQLCGKQFKITAGDVILVEGYWEPSNGDQLRLDKVRNKLNVNGNNPESLTILQVLIAGAQDFSLIGRPILQKGLVDVQATVIEKSLSHTRTVFKKKRRKQYMRINFQRMQTTMLRINSIDIPQLVDTVPASLERELY